MHILPILHRMHTMTIHYLAFKILPEAQQTQASRRPRCPRPQKKSVCQVPHQPDPSPIQQNSPNQSIRLHLTNPIFPLNLKKPSIRLNLPNPIFQLNSLARTKSKLRPKPPCLNQFKLTWGKSKLNVLKPLQMKTYLKLKLHQKLNRPLPVTNLCPTAPPFLLLRVHSLLLHSPTAHLHIQPKPYLDLGLKMDPKWRRPSEASPFTYN